MLGTLVKLDLSFVIAQLYIYGELALIKLLDKYLPAEVLAI